MSYDKKRMMSFDYRRGEELVCVEIRKLYGWNVKKNIGFLGESEDI